MRFFKCKEGELPEKSFGLQLKASPLEWLISVDLPIVFQILKVEVKEILMKSEVKD